jgi:hypothetical protein
MNFDKRKEHALIYIGEGSIPRLVVEVGDEATLYHEGNLIMATIKAINANQLVGFITRSTYDPDLHPNYISGQEINFSEKNIFGISRKKRQA